MPGGTDLGVVSFLTAGQTRPDGADVLVMAAGRRVNSRVLAVGPGDFCRVVFELASGASEYFIYYGNPAAGASQVWDPPIGLLLETRRYNGGDLVDLDSLRRIIRESGPSFGSDFVPTIFQGYNLFGPNEDFVSLYRGRLFVEQPGEYAFATSSDDASFLLVNGVVVAQKPGWGGAVTVPRFAGPTRYLAKGLHTLEYYHVQGKATAIAAAYWRRPGEQHFHVIAPTAFPAPQRLEAGPAESRGHESAPDMELVGRGLLWLDNGTLIGRLALRNRTRQGSAPSRMQWDFGDGVLSAAPDPQHVFLRSGEVSVTLSVESGGRTHSVRQRFVIGPGWPCHLEQQETDATAYATITAQYDPQNIPLTDLLPGIELFHQVGRSDALRRWLASLFVSERRDALSEDQWMRYGMLYANLLEESGDGQEARQFLTLCLSAVRKPLNRARLLMRRGEVTLDVLREPDAAAEDFRSALALREGSAPDVFRRAQIRLGDAARQNGHYELARAEYEKALMMRPTQSAPEGLVTLGAWQHSIEQHLLNGDLILAANLLDTWEWERPQDRLEGLTTLFRARLALLRQQPRKAIQEAQDLVRVNPTSQYAPALLLVAARAHRALDEPDKARIALETLLKDYPEASEQSEARRLLRDMAQ